MSESLYDDNPVEGLRDLARFAESEGLHTKSKMVDHLAEEMDLYEPVVRAMEEARDEGEIDREQLKERISQLEDG